jgi:hypothetical protein
MEVSTLDRQCREWLLEFCSSREDQPAGWTVEPRIQFCAVRGIQSADLALAFKAFVRTKGAVAEIIPPSTFETDWSAVVMPQA